VRVRCAAFFLCGAALLIIVVPLLVAKAVLLMVDGMTLFLICCPLWGDLRA
jgi:hypothetical protein